jgi:hypothetical protein
VKSVTAEASVVVWISNDMLPTTYPRGSRSPDLSGAKHFSPPTATRLSSPLNSHVISSQPETNALQRPKAPQGLRIIAHN